MEEIAKYKLQPAVITCDFDAMGEKLTDLLKEYGDLSHEVVAKMDKKDIYNERANLAKMSKELNDARKAVKKDYDAPLREFERKVKELDARIKEPWKLLDDGYKAKEESEKSYMRDQLEAIYADFAVGSGLPSLQELVPFERIFDRKWLTNDGFKHAPDEIVEKAAGIVKDWKTLDKTDLNYHDDCIAEFFRTLDLRSALDHDQQRAEEAAKVAALKADTKPAEERWAPTPKQPEYVGPWVAIIDSASTDDMLMFGKIIGKKGVTGTFKRGTIKDVYERIKHE